MAAKLPRARKHHQVRSTDTTSECSVDNRRVELAPMRDSPSYPIPRSTDRQKSSKSWLAKTTLSTRKISDLILRHWQRKRPAALLLRVGIRWSDSQTSGEAMPGERDASRNKDHVHDDCLAGHDCDGNVARSSHSAVVISPTRSAVESFDYGAGRIRGQPGIIRAARAVKSGKDHSV